MDLSFSWESPSERDKLTIAETAYFDVQVDDPTEIESLHQHIGPIRQLVSLGFGDSVAPCAVDVFTPYVTSDIGAKSVEEPLELIRAYVHPDDQIDPDIWPMFTLDDLPGSFEGALPRWYELSRRLEPALVVYFGALYGRPRYRDDELLLLVIAAESYHRLSPHFQQTTQGKDVDRWNAVLASAPTELKDWLGGRIGESLQRRLWERLRDLAHHPGPSGRRIAKRIPDFPSKLANWRNRLIHYDPTKDAARLDGAQMAHACFVLRCLLTGCLLRDMGVEEATVEVMLGRSRPARYAMELNPWEDFAKSAESEPNRSDGVSPGVPEDP